MNSLFSISSQAADPALDVLRSVFGYSAFRGQQAEIIDHVVHGGDALVLMPTGGGKSLCYQIPALVRDGLAVVVSPLIALMRDQVTALREAGVRAAFLNSSLDPNEAREVERAVARGELDLLYVAPERLVTPRFLDLLDRTDLALFALDEAHCVSQWGHDFRPEYLQLSILHERHPMVPRIALTATADAQTRAEIAEKLGLGEARVFISSFDRPNITYRVVPKKTERQQLLAFLRENHAEDAGIIYCMSRAKVEDVAAWLNAQGREALPYHAGLPPDVREANQDLFIKGEGIVMVATVAFGMGIDKPNVRFVVHAAVPESVDEYYQELGRAGRDGEPATAALHYRPEDLALRKFFTARTPDRGRLRGVYEVVEAAGRPIPPARIGKELDLATRSITGAVNLLADAGVLGTARKGVRIVDPVGADEAAERAVQTAEERERIERSRLEMMRAYAENRDCRRAFLLGYFGEERLTDCGHCDTCLARLEEAAVIDGEEAAPVDHEEIKAAEAAAQEAAKEDAYPLQAAVTHKEWGPGVVMRHEDDRITVFFEQEGYKVLSRRLIEENDLLTVD